MFHVIILRAHVGYLCEFRDDAQGESRRGG